VKEKVNEVGKGKEKAIKYMDTDPRLSLVSTEKGNNSVCRESFMLFRDRVVK